MNRNDITRLVTDDDAVSPVIAVILMVAVTVILGAIIGSLVLGVGSEQAKAPQASLAYDYDSTSTTVTVQHRGGDDLEASKLSVKETGSSDGVSITGGQDTFESGSVVASGTYEPGETIRVVWLDPHSKDSTVIAESRAPT